MLLWLNFSNFEYYHFKGLQQGSIFLHSLIYWEISHEYENTYLGSTIFLSDYNSRDHNRKYYFQQSLVEPVGLKYFKF